MQTPDEDAGIAAVKEAIELGITFFDTAPFYGSGSAERVQRRPLQCCPARHPAVAHADLAHARQSQPVLVGAAAVVGQGAEGVPEGPLPDMHKGGRHPCIILVGVHMGLPGSWAWRRGCAPVATGKQPSCMHACTELHSGQTARQSDVRPSEKSTVWQVGKYGPGQPADFSGERVTRSVAESLERLGMEHIDVILVHDVEYIDDLQKAWPCFLGSPCLTTVPPLPHRCHPCMGGAARWGHPGKA